MKIREANHSDLPEIIGLWKEFMDFHRDLDSFYKRSQDGPSNFRKHLESQLESEDDALLIAEVSGKTIGYIKIGISQYPPVFEMEKYGLISDVAVAEQYRRKGIGEALYEQAMVWFKDKSIERVELRVANVNPVAQGFWKKMGFIPYMTTMFKEK